VVVTGAVARPGVLYLTGAATTVLEALARAGGPAEGAGDERLIVQRPGVHEQREGMRVDAMRAAALSGGLLSNARAQNAYLLRETSELRGGLLQDPTGAGEEPARGGRRGGGPWSSSCRRSR